MSLKLANRINEIEESKSISLTALVDQLRREGKDIISLSVGEPDFSTPPSIIKATKEALESDKTRYSSVAGLLELRQLIAKKVGHDFNQSVNATNILVSNGSKQVLYNIFQTICDPGDEILIPIPYWVTFPESVKLAGGKPVFVSSKNFHLDLSAIKKSISKKTKAIILNTPNNPSGAVYTKEELTEVIKLAKEHNFYLICDEAYNSLVYDKHDFFSCASFDEDTFNRTITVQTFSKSYCMTGFRVGYMVANSDIIKAVDKLQGHITGNNCTFAQYGAIEAMKMPASYLENNLKIFESRRDLCFERAKDLFDCFAPEGAFYLFFNVEKYLGSNFLDDISFSKFLLEKAHVALLPGSAFGMPGYLRLSFSENEKILHKAFDQIQEALKGLK